MTTAYIKPREVTEHEKREYEDLAEKDAVEQSERSREYRDGLKDVDELLDEIDDILETNADEFVKAYVQQVGE